MQFFASRWFWLLIAPVLLVLWIGLVPLGPLTPQAHRLAAILLVTVLWWVTEPIPIPMTGLAAIALAVFLGAVPAASGSGSVAKTVLAPFADPSVYFLLGGLFLARAMTRHGLDRRLALGLLVTRWAGSSGAGLLLAVGLGVGLASMAVSNTAATAMMAPITLGIIRILAEKDPALVHTRFATALLLMTAYASSVGGVATPIGTATNVLAIGLIRSDRLAGRSIDFVEWATVGLPLALVLMVLLTCWLSFWSGAWRIGLPAALKQELRQRWVGLGSPNWGEWSTAVVFGFAVVLWILPSLAGLSGFTEFRGFIERRFPEEIVALMIPVLLFILPGSRDGNERALAPDDLAHIDWGTTLLFGAGLALGNLLFTTGLARELSLVLLELSGGISSEMLVVIAIVAGVLLSEITSNAATAATLIPVFWAVAKEASLDPLPAVLAVTFAASFGSALPVSTPPNAIVYGSGLIPLRRMVIAGLLFDVMAMTVVYAVLKIAFSANWSPLVD